MTEILAYHIVWTNCRAQTVGRGPIAEKVAKGAGPRHWFIECGDCEFIDRDKYLANAIVYVNERQ